MQSDITNNLLQKDPDGAVDDYEIKGYVSSQWYLIWRKFRTHRLAVISGVIVIGIYLMALFADFLAPYDPEMIAAQYTYAPPQPLRLFQDGQFAPHVFGYSVEADVAAMRRIFVIDEEKVIPVGLLVSGHPYRLLGLIETDIHLIGPLETGQPMYLLGADRLGRDMLSRLLYGARISMSIGLIGVFISLVIGVVLGGISGYSGGWIDNLIQRIIEFLRSIPTIPLWMALAAAMPLNWPPMQIYLGITIILSFIGWTDLARVVRGRYLSLREEDFVIAARLDGASQAKIMFQHMLPAFYSHIIATLTLAIPSMILAETALSFLGLGLRPPAISWGVLLQEAQNLRSVATAPWLLSPAIAIITAVLALNFLGDGLRDAADPYA